MLERHLRLFYYVSNIAQEVVLLKKKSLLSTQIKTRHSKLSVEKTVTNGSISQPDKLLFCNRSNSTLYLLHRGQTDIEQQKNAGLNDRIN